MKNIRLLEVKGYYNKGNMLEFTEEQSWKGHVILREDLIFEGTELGFTLKKLEL